MLPTFSKDTRIIRIKLITPRIIKIIAKTREFGLFKKPVKAKGDNKTDNIAAPTIEACKRSHFNEFKHFILTTLNAIKPIESTPTINSTDKPNERIGGATFEDKPNPTLTFSKKEIINQISCSI